MQKITRKTPPLKKTAKKNGEIDQDLEIKGEEQKAEKKEEISSEETVNNTVASGDAPDLEAQHKAFKASFKPEPEVKKEEQGSEKPGVEHSEEYDINPKAAKEKEQSTVKVNFMKPNAMSEFIKKSTEKGSSKTGEEETTNAPGDKKAEVVANESGEASDGNAFSQEDFQDFAEVFMDILDMGISTGLRFWSKDNVTTEYELDVNKKRRLVRQLTKLFMKYQTKFSLEFMFIVTLVIAYSVPVSKANKRRKQLKNGVPEEVTKRGPGQPKKR